MLYYDVWGNCIAWGYIIDGEPYYDHDVNVRVEIYNSGGSLLNYAQCTIWAWTSGEVFCPLYTDLQYTMSSPDIYYIRSTVDGELVRWYDSHGNLQTPNEAWVKYKLGAISGQIIDPDETGVPGTITVYNSAGSVVATKTTDASGNWNVQDLMPGSYNVCTSGTSEHYETCKAAGVESDKTSVWDAVVTYLVKPFLQDISNRIKLWAYNHWEGVVGEGKKVAEGSEDTDKVGWTIHGIAIVKENPWLGEVGWIVTAIALSEMAIGFSQEQIGVSMGEYAGVPRDTIMSKTDWILQTFYGFGKSVSEFIDSYNKFYKETLGLLAA